jgi:cyclopropane fatty-acyl-phospholipid synthase-like methyltransferase
MEELTREHLFKGNELDIDKVADMIQQEPWRTREILWFIADEMHKEEEFKEKLHELKDDYEEKVKELHKEYWMEHLLD